MITKEEFNRYEEVRLSGRTNMIMINTVSALAGLDKDKVIEIIGYYSEIKNRLSSNQETVQEVEE